MAFKIAINGYGRIGRMVLRALYERKKHEDLQLDIIAINEPAADIRTISYLTQYDSSHGHFAEKVEINQKKNILLINDQPIHISGESDPENLNLGNQKPDIILECSGSFSKRAISEKYLAHSPRLLFSHPSIQGADATIVFGFNHETLSKNHTIISCASCTTNCIVPVIHLLDEFFKIKNGCTTTMHSVMNDQPVIDAYHHKTLRLNRSALQSLIPVETALSKGIDRLLPHLKGRFQSTAIRAPVTNVSAMDLVVNFEKRCTVAQVNELLQNASVNPKLAGILGYTENPHVSIDFNHDPRSGIVDGTQTRVSGNNTAKLFCWFDNEWGFANRMLDVSQYWLKKSSAKT